MISSSDCPVEIMDLSTEEILSTSSNTTEASIPKASAKRSRPSRAKGVKTVPAAKKAKVTIAAEKVVANDETIIVVIVDSEVEREQKGEEIEQINNLMTTATTIALVNNDSNMISEKDGMINRTDPEGCSIKNGGECSGVDIGECSTENVEECPVEKQISTGTGTVTGTETETERETERRDDTKEEIALSNSIAITTFTDAAISPAPSVPMSEADETMTENIEVIGTVTEKRKRERRSSHAVDTKPKNSIKTVTTLESDVLSPEVSMKIQCHQERTRMILAELIALEK